jgi:hypothetical protein
MKTKKTQWYQLEVTDEQLQIIQECVGAVSRAKMGQFHFLISLILEDYDICDYDFVASLEKCINSKIDERLENEYRKGDVDMYQVYRDILHYWAVENGGSKWNICRNDWVDSHKPRIKIKEIKTK